MIQVDAATIRKALREEAPEAADDLNAIRDMFPGSRVTYLRVGDKEHGRRPRGMDDPPEVVSVQY